MPKEQQMRKVDIKINSGSGKQTYTVFVKHGQRLIEAIKELEMRGVLATVCANGFHYIYKVNEQAAGSTTNKRLPWYPPYPIDPDILNGELNSGFELSVDDDAGRPNVPVIDYMGKKYFLTPDDILVTRDMGVNIDKSDGGMYEYTNGSAVLNESQADGIWTPNDITNELERDPNAFLTPVEEISYGWLIKDEILHPGKKIRLELETARYCPIRFEYSYPEFKREKIMTAPVDRIMPSLLEYQKKLVRENEEMYRRKAARADATPQKAAYAPIPKHKMEHGREVSIWEEREIFECGPCVRVKSVEDMGDEPPPEGGFGGGMKIFDRYGKEEAPAQDVFARSVQAPVEKTTMKEFSSISDNVKNADWAGMKMHSGDYEMQKDSQKTKVLQMVHTKAGNVDAHMQKTMNADAYVIKTKTGSMHAHKTKTHSGSFSKAGKMEFEKAHAMEISKARSQNKIPKKDLKNEKIKAVLFDLDGILSDSEEAHRKSFNMVFAKYGVKPVGREYWLKNYTGTGSEFIMQDVAQKNHLGKTVVPKMLVQRKEIFATLALRQGIKPIKGSKKLVRLVTNKGLKLIVASGGHRKHVRTQLDSLGLERMQFLGMEDVKSRKPAPDVFLKAAKRLGVPPKLCLVIDDAASGLKAAKKAGMKIILIGRHHPKKLRKTADLWATKLDSKKVIDFVLSLVQRI